MVFNRILITSLALFIGSTASSKDLGDHGTTWHIQEDNLLDLIYSTLKEKEANGDVEKLQEEMTSRTKQYVQRPRPVLGLIKAKENKEFLFDPSIQVTKDLADHEGRVFAKKGTWINPLDFQPFTKRLVFIDGDDQDQVDFALLDGTELNRMIVITNGAPFELTEKYKTRFWFDQDAVMVKRFGIEALPTEISVEGRMLLIKEVFLDD